MQGTNTTKSIQASLRYDTRDRIFNPTEGSLNSISIEYAGFGGDIAFTKYIAKSGWYFPILFGTIGLVHGKAGYVQENPDGFLPDFEKFYLGGINSVRGFRWRDIHAEDDEGKKIGGTRFVQMNLEWIIPLVKNAGLVGVFFVDAGKVFGEDEEIELKETREGGGLGIRWYSPLGPIRLEYGWILDPEEGESTAGRWEFTVGSSI
jgi:outer membrane protein insertion porin family